MLLEKLKDLGYMYFAKEMYEMLGPFSVNMHSSQFMKIKDSTHEYLRGERAQGPNWAKLSFWWIIEQNIIGG